MKKNLLPTLACSNCHSSLKLKKTKFFQDRILSGILSCKKCGSSFKIIEGIVYFKSVAGERKNKKKIKKMQKLFLSQELERKWLKNFEKKEKESLKNEWHWMIGELELKKTKLHLDWAVGTGRFLRNTIDIINGEIVVMDIDYATCLGLKYFLTKIKKYNKISILCCDAKKMPFLNNSIDSAGSWHGIDEPDVRDAIQESKRVLKDGGVLVVSGIFFEKKSESLKFAKKFKINFAEKNEARKFLKRSGFCNIKYKTFGKIKEIYKENFLPKFGDYYTIYALSGKNRLQKR